MSQYLLALLVLVGAAGSGEGSLLRAQETTFEVPGGTITVDLDSSLAPKAADLHEWVERAATAVTHYYGHFPVSALRIEIKPRAGEPVNSGREFDGRLIRIHVDPAVTAADLRHDWMLTHEMFHLGFPSLDPAYHYMEEGLSDYLEPLARVRVGQTRPTQPWQDFIEGMPQGLPIAGESGLDGTRDWGRTYWGGCIFWLLVDLDIRERSSGHKSLDDAIRAIVAAGGTGGADWPLERVIQVGDAATGTGSIRRLHDQMGRRPLDPHLEALWRNLGVSEQGGQVEFDDTAPLASLRQAMTRPVGP